MVYFQTKNPNLGKCLGALDWTMLIYFMANWNILRTFGKFCDDLVHSFTFVPTQIWQPSRRCLMEYLHNLTDISENCVVRHLKVSYNKNRIDPICENCVVCK
jgi:hypothetical protein